MNTYSIAIYDGPNWAFNFDYHGPEFPHGVDLQSLLLAGITYECDMRTDIEEMDVSTLNPEYDERSDLRTTGNEDNERVYIIYALRCQNCDARGDHDDTVDAQCENYTCESADYMVTIVKEAT